MILLIADLFFCTLEAMSGDKALVAYVKENAKRSQRTAESKRGQELDLLTRDLHGLIEEYVRKEKEEALVKSIAEPLVDFSFEKYALTESMVAGGLSREAQNVIALLKNPTRFKELGLKELPIGLLLHGPSGSGKTMLAKIIASETGRLMAHEYSSSFITSFQGSGVERMRRLFEEARKLNKPVIIFIDEIDGLANNDLKGSEGEATRAVHEMHRQLGMSNQHVFVIMATNNYDTIPASIKDRFANHTLFIGLPDFSQRLALLKQLCAHARVQVSEQFFYALATETEGLSCRIVENVVKNACIGAGQRASATAVIPSDFYIAAYTTQTMKLPGATRRLQLIKHYLSGKNLSADVNDEFLNSCVQETEGWEASKIEKWINLAHGLACAKGYKGSERAHFFIASSLIDNEKVPTKIRRKLLLSHFLDQRHVKDLLLFQDFLLEETEDFSTGQLQQMVELAVENIERAKGLELTKESLLTACALISKKPLTYYKRRLLLQYFLEDTPIALTKEFLDTLALQMEQVSVQGVKDVVGKARDIALSRGLLKIEPDDFYVALCLNQKNKPLCLREYRVALVKYYLKNRMKNNLSQNFFDVLIDGLNDQTPLQVESVVQRAEEWVHQRRGVLIANADISLALYENCFKNVCEQSVIRESIIYSFLEGKGSASTACVQKLVDFTAGFTLPRIKRIFDQAKEAANGNLCDDDLYIGLHLELKNDEQDLRIVYKGYILEDKVPFGNPSKLLGKQERRVLLKHYLRRKYHKVSDAFKEYFADHAAVASRHGIARVIDKALVYASLVDKTLPEESIIQEYDMIKAIGEVYPYIGFWPWHIQSFGGIRDAYHTGFHLK